MNFNATATNLSSIN